MIICLDEDTLSCLTCRRKIERVLWVIWIELGLSGEFHGVERSCIIYTRKSGLPVRDRIFENFRKSKYSSKFLIWFLGITHQRVSLEKLWAIRKNWSSPEILDGYRKSLLRIPGNSQVHFARDAKVEVLFSLDIFYVGDSFYHELTMIIDGLPNSYIVKQRRVQLNDICHNTHSWWGRRCTNVIDWPSSWNIGISYRVNLYWREYSPSLLQYPTKEENRHSCQSKTNIAILGVLQACQPLFS